MKNAFIPKATSVLISGLLVSGLQLTKASANDLIASQSAATINAANTSKAVEGKSALDDKAAASVTEESEFEEPEEAANWTAIHGNLNRSGQSKAAAMVRIEPGTSRLLEASIDISDGDPVINSQIKLLTDDALSKNSKMKDAKAAFERYSTVSSQSAAKSRDALNILIAYRGFASSKEAGDILLDEKLRLNGLPASELAMQKELDSTNSAVVENLMQIAMGLGLKDVNSQTEVVAGGFKNLSALVGAEAAQNSVDTLASWHKRLRMPEKVYKTSIWSPAEQQEKLRIIQEAALNRDPFISKVTGKMHKYNKKSKVSMAAGHVIEGGLGVACLVPSAIGPAAQIALTGFEMATGGSEENKLLKQIYLSKRLESRTLLIKEKAALALQNYQMGMMTKNPALLTFAESLVAQMAGDEVVRKVFGQTLADLKLELKSASLGNGSNTISK
ncbi:MAG: hypothetical protein K2X27_20060 [Candidatus Obscuribacterales bacterium]|nr:hypothetical protein [Candidatus Obscuribacterales bacterium]